MSSGSTGWATDRPAFEPLESRLLLDGVVASDVQPVVDRPFLQADVNQDGKVDGADLAVWQNHYDPLAQAQSAWWQGDFNADRKVDGSDLALWQSAYDPLGTAVGGVYAQFNRFAIDNFGAERDDLSYETFGEDLTFLVDGDWVYESVESATVAFQTNLPARSYVQFGSTEDYGFMTSPTERPFSVQVHYLTGLDASSTVHYRLVTMDERGNLLFSEDRTLDTTGYAGKIKIVPQSSDTPYTLDQAGKTYIVTADLVLDDMAFDIIANNVTLDLNGHTVVYNNTHNGLDSDSFWDYIHDSEFGVRGTNVSGVTILNGTIRQGAGLDSAETGSSIGFNPIYLRGCSNVEVAGVTVAYSGLQMIGMYNHWQGSGQEFHHNVYEDHGTTVEYRHGAGCRALVFYGSSNPSGSYTHHNLVKRTRHMGIQGALVQGNEVYVDSWDTNSFAIGTDPGGTSELNRVFCTGYNPFAFGWSDQITIRDNWIQLQSTEPTNRSDEYGALSSVNGIRLTQYNGGTHLYRDNLYENNVILGFARDGGSMRGVQFFSDPYVSDLVFRDNIVKVIAEDVQTTQVACVVTQGQPARTETQLPIYYIDNTFIANVVHIRFGDSYGTGSNHRFYGCEFIRVGNRPDYYTFYFGTAYPSKYHVIRDAVMGEGTSLSSIHWVSSTADHGFSVEWTVTVNTTPGATVTMTDKYDTVAYTEVAGPSGVVTSPLKQYDQVYSGRTYFGNYTFRAVLGGLSAEDTLPLNQPLEIDLYPM